MKNRHYAALLCAVALAGCGGGSTGTVEIESAGAEPQMVTAKIGDSAPKQAAATPIDEAKIERCWIGAGLKGDIYKFMTPEEAQGISKIGGASSAQMQSFKDCLAS